MMIKNRIQTVSFFTALALALASVLFIFKPFFPGLFLALTFAIVSRPLYRWVDRRFSSKPILSTTTTFLIIVALILVPTGIIGTQIFNQAQDVYQNYLGPDGGQSVKNTTSEITKQITGYIPGLENKAFDLEPIRQKFTTWITDNLNQLFSSAISLAVNLLVFLFALFYLIKDGSKFKKALYKLSPLSKDDSESIIKRFEATVHSVVLGSLLVALIQGIITTIGLFIFRVPEAFLLGSASVIAALIPGVGPSIIMLPAAVFLYFAGHTWAAIGLAIWSILIVGTIDNFIRPFLIERGMKVHPFLILISVLGGLSVFGPIGFLLGPVVLSFFFSLVEIYTRLADEAI
ncbi:MAG: AI-2E family transporter [Candidatus Vogelbacteria bacterium]|jgi:predicted PurR-regulated permease PerM|nr:AI-2E family transporter [Candidatus Vogelbacteria bacterium]